MFCASADSQEAAFGIQGSDDRGKVVLTLASPIPQRDGVALANAIYAEAVSDLLFGKANGDVTVFPNNGSSAGNTVRLFGKNLKRPDWNLSLSESPLDLTGSLSDLWYLQPAEIEAQITTVVSKSTIHSRDMMVLLTEPYIGNGDTIASDMLKAAWRCESLTEFENCCERMLTQKTLSAGARDQLERSDFRTRTWAKRSHSKHVRRESRLGLWRPLTSPPDQLSERSPEWRVYKAATDYCLQIARNPHCLSITYGQWADLAKYGSKTACGKAVTKAEKCWTTCASRSRP